ncbi:hypothetical protein IV81_GL000236 [Pediococcus stilesii]|uniref:Uncharacterized protein n=1 Tax=Pediococcus stilesii TaxID=331679 RepID=A0A0R2KWH1_9LACO|nr:hypothetical protein IV81_GL000236 [Pediococcus stilesii]
MYLKKGDNNLALSQQQKEAIRDALLAIDDPYYFNTFKNAQDEDEWMRINEAYIQSDLQRLMPEGFDTRDLDVWRVIRSFLKQYDE